MTWKRCFFVSSSILLGLTLAHAQTVNITGRWEFKFTIPDGQQKTLFVLDLSATNEGITGKFVGPTKPFGSAEPENLIFDGKQLKFSVVAEGATLNFTGRWSGDHFEGFTTQPSVSWIAVRGEAASPGSSEEVAYKQALLTNEPPAKISALEKF